MENVQYHFHSFIVYRKDAIPWSGWRCYYYQIVNFNSDEMERIQRMKNENKSSDFCDCFFFVCSVLRASLALCECE